MADGGYKPAQVTNSKKGKYTMKRTLSETKKNMYREAYYHHNGRDLWQAYSNPSSAKVQAWRNCIAEMLDRDGDGATVVGRNDSIFTFGYLTTDENGVLWLNIKTPYNTYRFEY